MIDTVPDQLILQGTAAVLKVTLTDADGEPAAAAGAVTVAVTKADGTEVLAAGTATSAGDGTGEYTVTLTPAQTAALNVLTATWTDAGDSSTHTTRHEIIGGHWASVAEIRRLANLDNPAKFPTSTIQAVRDWVTRHVEDACGAAFTPRYRRDTLDGTGTDTLLLPTPRPRTVDTVRVYDDAGASYTSFTAAEITDLETYDDGRVVRSLTFWTRGQRNHVIEWTHGYDRPPADLKARTLAFVRQQLLEDRTGRNVLSIIDPSGITTRFASPGGSRRPTGDLELDEAIARYTHRIPGLA